MPRTGPGGPVGRSCSASPAGMLAGEEQPEDEMAPVEHIQQAIKHLMLAMLANDDEERPPGS